MVNLLDYISEEDINKIDLYMTNYAGVKNDHISVKEYLEYWANNNKKLFHLLGGKLIYTFPIKVEKPKKILKNKILSLTQYESYEYDTRVFQRFVRWTHWIKNGKMRAWTVDIEDAFYLIPQLSFYLNEAEEKKIINFSDDLVILMSGLFLADNLLDNSIDFSCFGDNTIDRFVITHKDKKKPLIILNGMKPLKAIVKIINYIDADIDKSLIELFRIKHSMILNERMAEGECCISIHPLDFMTMSDNESDWSSCMSWKKKGCFRVGTMEMMNSNNALCVYLKSKNDMKLVIDEEEEWNNKKWRSLFFITKDIIVSGKQYPYQHEELAKIVIEKLKELAKENLNWRYKYGIEPYGDMKYLHARAELVKAASNSENKKRHKILFRTRQMYNDMYEDKDTKYWCVRNKVDKTKVISVSGDCKCILCGGSKNEIFNWETSDLYCLDCHGNSSCRYCSAYVTKEERISVNSKIYCKKCANMFYSYKDSKEIHNFNYAYKCFMLKPNSLLDTRLKAGSKNIFLDENDEFNDLYLLLSQYLKLSEKRKIIYKDFLDYIGLIPVVFENYYNVKGMENLGNLFTLNPDMKVLNYSKEIEDTYSLYNLHFIYNNKDILDSDFSFGFPDFLGIMKDEQEQIYNNSKIIKNCLNNELI